MKNKKLIYSIILVAVVLLIILVISLLINQNKPVGSKIRVIDSSGVYGIYDLNEDKTVYIIQGQYRNVLEIKDGQANMIESNCENQICVNEAPISEENSMPIVCLPHEIVVELLDESESE